MKRTRVAWIGFLAFALAAPAGAQMGMSDSSTFLKAVRDRDGAKATELLEKPGATSLIRAHDYGTGDTALHVAAKRRDLTWLQFMLAKGADVNARDRQGMTALADAAQLGWAEGAQQLVAIGAQVDLADDRGETPLILAAQARNAGVVSVLIQGGADPRLTDNVAGLSALDYATRDGRSPAIVKLLQDAHPVAKKKAVAGPSIAG